MKRRREIWELDRIWIMSNPAKQLHTVMKRWRETVKANDGRQSSFGARGESKGPAETREAFAFLEKIVEHVDGWEAVGRDVQVYRRSVEAVTRMLLVFPSSWKDATSAEAAYPQAVLDSLEQIADLIDFAGERFIPPLAESKVDEFVAEVRAALDDDDTLPDRFRYYLERLLDSIAGAMEHRDADLLREDLEHLWIAVFAAEGASTENGRWGGIAKRFGWDTMTQTISSIGAALVTKALTGG